jgi:hypothetical protein
MLGIGKLYRFVEMEMRGEWIETPFFKRGLLQNVVLWLWSIERPESKKDCTLYWKE